MKLTKIPRFFYKKINNIETVPYEKVDTYIKKVNFRHKVVAVVGFVFGLRLCDALMYDEQDYIEVREQMEEEYWAHYGKPINLKPDVIPCKSRFKQGQTCETWIEIKFDKDRYVRKIDPAELKHLNK